MSGGHRFTKIWLAMALAGLCAAGPAAAGGSSEGARGSGGTVTREFDIVSFDGLEISDAFEAEIRRGDGYRVTVEIDEAAVPRLVVRRIGSILRVAIEPERLADLRSRRPRLAVTMPTLAGLELSGAVAATVSGFRSGGPLRLRLSGASSVTGDIQAAEVQVRASGASHVTLDGAGAEARLEASGASKVDFTGFATRNTAAVLSGASTAVVLPDGRLDVKASGASHLFYTGSPSMGRIELSGASTLSSR